MGFIVLGDTDVFTIPLQEAETRGGLPDRS
jgi:hypothetical protein